MVKCEKIFGRANMVFKVGVKKEKRNSVWAFRKLTNQCFAFLGMFVAENICTKKSQNRMRVMADVLFADMEIARGRGDHSVDDEFKYFSRY